MCLKKLAEFLSCLSWLSLPALYMYYTPLGDANVNDSCCFVSLIKMSSYIAGRLPLLCFWAFQFCQGKGQSRSRQQTMFSVCWQVLLLETLTSQSSAPTACCASDIKCLCMCIMGMEYTNYTNCFKKLHNRRVVVLYCIVQRSIVPLIQREYTYCNNQIPHMHIRYDTGM